VFCVAGRLLAGVEKAERIHLGWHQSPQLLEEGLVLDRFFDVVILEGGGDGGKKQVSE
jgi:hypothetical protein